MFTVSCPNCAATYQLDEAKVGAKGRKLKCAKCGHIWVAYAPGMEPVAEVVPPAEAAPDPATSFENDFAPQTASGLLEVDMGEIAKVGWMRHVRWLAGPRKWVVLGIVVCVLGTLGGLWLLLAGKDTEQHVEEVEAHENVAARETFEPEGLELFDVKADFVKDEKLGVEFGVHGMVRNTLKESVELPKLQVELLDGEGKVMDVWPVEMKKLQLDPGEDMVWGVSFTNPAVKEMAGWRAVFTREAKPQAPSAPLDEQPAVEHD